MPSSLSDSRDQGRVLPTIAVMLTTVMAVMDMTIVNVTLPHMMGALGATADQITWVLTAYIVAEAVTIPLTGWLAARFGRRRVMLFGIAGFVIASALLRTQRLALADGGLSPAAGARRGAADPALPGRAGESLPARAARQGDGDLGHRRHARTHPRTDRRRPGHRAPGLALGVLHQPAGGPAEPGPGRPEHPRDAPARGRCRLARRAPDDPRHRQPANRAGPRQSGGLAGFRVHPRAESDRRGRHRRSSSGASCTSRSPSSTCGCSPTATWSSPRP